MKRFLKTNQLTVSILRKIVKWSTRNRSKILMYHRFSSIEEKRFITASVFERQVKYLVNNNFNLITFCEFGQARKLGNKLPSNTVVLTFDDGYSDFYQIAYPILKKYGVTATLFVTTGFISEQFWMYQDKIRYLLENAIIRQAEIIFPSEEKRIIKAGSSEHLEALWNQLSEELLASSETERAEYLDKLSRQCDFIIPNNPPEIYSAVNVVQLKELHTNGIEIGSHCVHHLSLANQCDDVIKYELVESKVFLERQLKTTVNSFCYPFGMPNDVDGRAQKMVAEIGYNCACVAYIGKQENLFTVGRLGISNDFDDFLNKVNGLSK